LGGAKSFLDIKFEVTVSSADKDGKSFITDDDLDNGNIIFIIGIQER
jgi:hypothetical protein